MTEQAILSAIEREYEAAREEARALRDARVSRIEAEVPAFREAEARLRRIRAAVPAAALRSEAEAAALLCEAEQAKQALDALLHSAGHDPVELALQHACARCGDTGWVHSGALRTRCACFTQKKIERAYRSSGLCLLEEQNFERFDLSAFSDAGEAPTQRERMRRAKEICETYASSCPDAKKPNLLLVGETGLGKTYLCHCIAKAVLDAGHTVACLTAYRLFETLRAAVFGRGSDALPFEAELLIVDDLGTEPLFNEITLETLFTLYNERLLLRRPVVTATNLMPDQLRERYGERLFSRIVSPETTTLLRLRGEDIRMRRNR